MFPHRENSNITIIVGIKKILSAKILLCVFCCTNVQLKVTIIAYIDLFAYKVYRGDRFVVDNKENENFEHRYNIILKFV